MRGCQYAHIDANGLAAAKPLELAVLQDVQELGLQPYAHVSDFVQQDHAAIGRFELPRSDFHGTGEGSALVAEQLAFEQFLRQGGAVVGRISCFSITAGVEAKRNFRLVISVTLLQRSVAVEVDRDWVTPLAGGFKCPSAKRVRPLQ